MREFIDHPVFMSACFLTAAALFVGVLGCGTDEARSADEYIEDAMYDRCPQGIKWVVTGDSDQGYTDFYVLQCEDSNQIWRIGVEDGTPYVN